MEKPFLESSSAAQPHCVLALVYRSTHMVPEHLESTLQGQAIYRLTEPKQSATQAWVFGFVDPRGKNR